MTNDFVGNLDTTVMERQLREPFAARGAVETITIVKDKDTGEPRPKLHRDSMRDSDLKRSSATQGVNCETVNYPSIVSQHAMK